MERTAFITGGTGGLGGAVLQTFLGAGWRVVAPVRTEDERGRLPEHDKLEVVQADLFESGAVSAVVEAATSWDEAPLRAVVNLVGGFSAPGRVHEAPAEDVLEQLRVNVRPTYLVTQAALPHLMGGDDQGTVVCVSSRAAIRPFAGAAGYIMAKAAVLAFVRALDVEYRGDGVRSNAILPSVIDTPGQRAAMPDADHSKWVPPEEIARVALFLSSEDSAPVSGAEIPVYGRA